MIQPVAEYVIAKFNAKGDLITHRKLQKLLYYAQAWSLVFFEGKPLFKEAPEAWVHGPVYKDVYNRYKAFGFYPLKISEQSQEEERGEDEQAATLIWAKTGLGEKERRLVDELILKYGSMSSYQLEVLTHSEEPWLEQRKDLGELDASSRKISLETMRSYYSDKLKRAKKARLVAG